MAVKKVVAKEAVKEVKTAPAKAATEVKTEVKAAEVKAAPVKEEKVVKAEVKEAPAKKPAAKAAKAPAKKPAAKKAAKEEVKVSMNVQFGGKSYTTEDLVKIAKDVWKYDLKQKVADFKSVELYVKPEDGMTYYVINGKEAGSFYI
ncbi:MAG: DUF6465 family protein [Lachnospiraceae bacterium]